MPKVHSTKRTSRRRRPVKRERMAGLTVTVQRCNKGAYTHAVVMRRDGKRIREKYLRTKVEAEGLAEKWSVEAGNSGARTAASLTDADKRWIVEAREKLAVFGKTPADALAHYLGHLERCKVSITIADLIDKLLTEKGREKKSSRYRDDLRNRLNTFSADFGDRLAAAVTSDEISTWLANLDLSPVTVANYRRVLSVLFSHGVKLRACESNPVAYAMKPKAPDGEVEILTVAQANGLLRAAADRPEILPAIAIGMFAGVRDAELKRLDWRDLNFESGYIEIKGSKAKSARRRLIQIQPALRAWLEPVRQLGGPVWPAQAERGRKLHEAARRAVGFGTLGTETELEIAAGVKLEPWPHNALRHSFASYHLARFQNASALALEMGHTSSALIFAYYRELVMPKQAEAFWNLMPKQTPQAAHLIPPVAKLRETRSRAVSA